MVMVVVVVRKAVKITATASMALLLRWAGRVAINRRPEVYRRDSPLEAYLKAGPISIGAT